MTTLADVPGFNKAIRTAKMKFSAIAFLMSVKSIQRIPNLMATEIDPELRALQVHNPVSR
jgi:hypothetical protein